MTNAAKEPTVDMSSDAAWEEWGRRDPYYGVITDPKFRRSAINENSRRAFFESGAAHAHHVLTMIRKHVNSEFVPRRVLDFGCGVGRVLVPLAAVAEEAIGVDVSPSMLEEARRNCDERQVRNVRLLPSDDNLSTLTGTFDLIHSCIVFQHIPVERGRAILSRLLRYLSWGGVAAIHITYSKSIFAATHGVPPPATRPAPAELPIPSTADPVIQMNCYNLNEILFMMQGQGAQRFYAEFSDHGGELGVFFFFSLPVQMTTA
jgi:SAM-dependent methyltransferase